jgi:hypothetical protein
VKGPGHDRRQVPDGQPGFAEASLDRRRQNLGVGPGVDRHALGEYLDGVLGQLRHGRRDGSTGGIDGEDMHSPSA